MAKFLTNIDLRQNQLKNTVIEQLASAPVSAKAGQVYFNTTTKKFCVCVDADNQTWESFATVDALASAVSDLDGKIALKADQTALEQAITDLEGKIDAKDHLPEQTDNAGKVLTTNGTSASWDHVIKMNNVTEGTEAGLSKLVINKLTKSEYDALEAAGQIKDTELYITDAEAYTKEEIDSSLALKADTATVNSALDTKANQSALESAVSTLEGQIATKADSSTLTSEIERIEGVIENLDCLPTQADNAGKFLTTDGTSASWGALPEATAALKGIVKIASADEITAGTSTTSVVTVAQLNAVSGGASGAISGVEQKIDNHIADLENPHQVTAEQVGLGNVDNTSDADKPVSTAQQAALDLKADKSALEAHTTNVENPHQVTKAQVGLGNVDNTSDADKPISTATQAALDLKADKATVETSLNGKADKATTLEGYGITDAYTQTQINDALALKANAADVYTKTEVDAKVSSVYKFKGTVATVDALPTEGNVEGDVYNVTSTGENYAWVAATETEEGFWDDLGGDIDLTPYLTKDEASTTYLTQTTAASTYLTQTDASSTYLTQTNAASTYLTQTDASNTYATKDELTQVNQGSVHKISAQNTELVPADGVATWTVAHTMGTDVDVVIKEVATNEVVYADVVMNSNEVVIKINSDSTIAADTYKAIILG